MKELVPFFIKKFNLRFRRILIIHINNTRCHPKKKLVVNQLMIELFEEIYQLFILIKYINFNIKNTN